MMQLELGKETIKKADVNSFKLLISGFYKKVYYLIKSCQIFNLWLVGLFLWKVYHIYFTITKTDTHTFDHRCVCVWDRERWHNSTKQTSG